MNKRRIIVVDDEDAVASLISIILTNLGYETVIFANGKDAVDDYSKNYEDVYMVIADLSMPGMSGVDLVKNILKINSNEVIIIVTGLIKDNIQHQFPSNSVRVLQKPFSLHELRDMVDLAIEIKKDFNKED